MGKDSKSSISAHPQLYFPQRVRAYVEYNQKACVITKGYKRLRRVTTGHKGLQLSDNKCWRTVLG